MDPLSLVRLTPLMDRSRGRPEVAIGLIDGPVALDHPALARAQVRELRGRGASSRPGSNASLHAVFVAGILSAERGASAPAICPDCTLLVRPIFGETTSIDDMPSTTPAELADAILDCVAAGARVLNISAALAPPFLKNEQALEKALTYAATRGVIVVAAAGNHRTLAGTTLTRHQWVVPVVSYSLQGRPSEYSTLGHSIGRRGLGAPGDAITSLGADGTSGDVRRDERRRAVRHRSDGLAVVRVPVRDRGRRQVRCHPRASATPHGRSSIARCVGRVSGAQEVTDDQDEAERH